MNQTEEQRPNFRFRIGLARTLRLKGSTPEAVAILKKIESEGVFDKELFDELAENARVENDLESCVHYWGLSVTVNASDFTSQLNLATALSLIGDCGRAALHYEIAAELRPDNVQAHFRAAQLFANANLPEKAIPHFQAAMQLDPDNPEILSAFGDLLLKGYDLAGAVACFKKALQIRPDYPHALAAYAEALPKTGDFANALILFRRYLDTHKDPSIHSDMLFWMNHDIGRSSQEIHDEHRRWAQSYAENLPQFSSYNSLPGENRPLRIGYISPDFRAHPVGYFLEPVLKNHNPQNCEVYCYYSSAESDERTKFFRAIVPHWRDIAAMSDPGVAEMIQTDRIDILVDLAGHTSNNRLLTLARKPAPVQVTWIGYPGTTGLTQIDYRFTDAIADPPERDRFHSEKLFRLSPCFLCYAPPRYAPGITGAPFAGNGFITFGSFNRLPKINDSVIETWSRILQKVPGSKLLLKTASFNDPRTRDHFAKLFSLQGIDLSRIDLRCGTQTPEQHLDTYNEIDIALDTFPYNGTTTSCEALLMGVPVICLQGEMHAGRVGASLLSSMGIQELLGLDREGYVQAAVRLARNADGLLDYRNTLRTRLCSSALGDGARFAETIEYAYRAMWRNYLLSAPL